MTAYLHAKEKGTVMEITNTSIRNAKPKEKQYKLTDGRGMYLLVNKTGKYFRYDYRYAGKRKTLALGVYPDVGLAEAREKLDDARRLLKNGVDPSQHRKEMKAKRIELSANSFESVTLKTWNSLWLRQ